MKKIILIVFLLSSVALYSQVEPLDTDGDGRRNVTTLDNLRWMSELMKYMYESYELDNDIDASDTKNWNEGKGFMPIGTEGYDLVGLFDGQGHEIKNLYINRPNEDYIGLFGYFSGTKITNLHLQNFDIVGGNNTGSIVGFLNGGKLDSCYSNNGKVVGKNYVGGLIGYSENSYIYNSQSNCVITGKYIVGGFIGWNYNCSIYYCQSEGKVTGLDNVGGFIGSNVNSLIQYCIAKGDVDGNSGVGGFAGGNSGEINISYSRGKSTGDNNAGGFLGRSDGGSVNGCLWDSETSGLTYSAGGFAKTTEEMKSKNKLKEIGWNLDDIWDISDSYPFINIRNNNKPVDTDGNGIPNIVTISQLRWLSEVPLSLVDNYELSKDIDASDTRNWNCGLGFAPIGNKYIIFEGYVNGNHYSIKNLFINRLSQSNIGLFGILSYSNIKTLKIIENLNLENCDISGNDFVGSLAAMNSTYKIRNCSATGKVSGTNYVGGLIGSNTGYRGANDVNKCFTDVNVYGNGKNIGGVAGFTIFAIVDSYSKGDVSGNENVGGVVGYDSTVYIVNSYSTGRVQGSTNVGGIVGKNVKGNVSTSFWDVETSGISKSEGIGKGTANMKKKSTFTDIGWDFDTIWDIDGITNDGYPFLRDLIVGVEYETFTSESFFDIFPNPAVNFARIKINFKESGNIRMELYDLTGRLMKNLFEGHTSFGDQNFNLDLSDISSGIYQVILYSENEVRSRLLVVQ